MVNCSFSILWLISFILYDYMAIYDNISSPIVVPNFHADDTHQFSVCHWLVCFTHPRTSIFCKCWEDIATFGNVFTATLLQEVLRTIANIFSWSKRVLCLWCCISFTISENIFLDKQRSCFWTTHFHAWIGYKKVSRMNKNKNPLVNRERQ